VRIQRQADQLVDQPVAILVGQSRAQAFLELRAQIPIDHTHQFLDRRQSDDSLPNSRGVSLGGDYLAGPDEGAAEDPSRPADV